MEADDELAPPPRLRRHPGDHVHAVGDRTRLGGGDTLGLARHYAALPRAERPETLVFMALGGHEVGWLGLQALLGSAQGGALKEADAYVHLGSALGAPSASEEPDGMIVTSPVPDPTGRLHDSENPLLEAGVIEDFVAAGVPTPETPPVTASGGEQTNAYAAGIPTASFSGVSLFFRPRAGQLDPRCRRQPRLGRGRRPGGYAVGELPLTARPSAWARSPLRPTATRPSCSQRAISPSSAARAAATSVGSAPGSAKAPCTRSTPAWRSAFRSTRATSSSPRRNGST